jgi:hypothetical protein
VVFSNIDPGGPDVCFPDSHPAALKIANRLNLDFSKLFYSKALVIVNE